VRPLLVIGGFWDLNVSPPLYRWQFHRMTGDDRIVTVSLGLCGSFEECRAAVIEAVDRAFPSDDPVYTSEVDVVGASLGGLVARVAAAPSAEGGNPRRLKVVRLFTISSPHTGATLAADWGFTQFHRDMRPGSSFLEGVARSDAGATYELIPYVRLGDGIVGDHHAAPPNQTPYWVPNPPLQLAHAGAMTDPRIFADIARQLRGEHPFTHAPPAPLPGTAAAAD
jgi:pimeloyl-ACP methyl ester carboxylesterase